MDIVEVQFIKDTQCVQTGNEFYVAGSRAHFYDYQTDYLIAQEWAVLTSKPPSGESPFPPTPNYSKMTVKQLKAEMHKHNILFTSGMRKADLITALEENNG